MSKTIFFSFHFVLILSGIFLLKADYPAKDKLAEDVLRYTNQFRKSNGLTSLVMKADLNEIAEKHSEDMASGKRSFGHGGYNQRMLKVQKKFTAFKAMAENVAYGANSGKEVVDIWKNSTGHRKNMLGNYKYIGIGTARSKKGIIYYTQILVR